jgi:hypothetical protein
MQPRHSVVGITDFMLITLKKRERDFHTDVV